METETLNLNNLRKLLKKEQYGKALDLCDKTLAQNPADIELYKVKFLCCINLQKFQDALEIADFNGEFAFEKAYCLYRMNKLNEALNICNSIKVKSDDVLNLQAQTLYKLQRYDEATNLYQNLVNKQTSSEIDTDLYTNLYSASVSAGQSQHVLNEYHLDESSIGNSFELMYNIGCAQISVKDLTSASLSLQKAYEICTKLLSEDGLSEEQIAHESRAIRLQISLIDILNGHETNSSLELCRTILKSTKHDNELLAVAANNLTVLRGSTDLPDSLRRLKNTISSSTEEKLTKSQLMEIRYNRAILLLHTKRFDECLKSLDELDKIYGITTRSLLIRASTQIVLGNFSSCEELLQSEYVSSQSTLDITPLLILKAQIFILKELYFEAEEVINSLDENLKYTPSVISTIYQLKVLQKNSETSTKPSNSISYLLSVAKKLDNLSTNISDTIRASTLFQISQELEQNGYYEDSASVLQSLLNRCSSCIDSSERFMILSKIAIAFSHILPNEAEKVIRSLPKLNTNSIDAQLLEQAEVPRLAKKFKTIQKQKSLEIINNESNSQNQKSKETKKARILRRRIKLREAYLKRLQELGKYDPTKPTKPDPERWIPLKHRSYSKRGRKNRNKFVGGQGSGDGAQKDMLRLDAYARSMAAPQEGNSKKQGVVIEAPTSTGGKKGRKKR